MIKHYIFSHKPRQSITQFKKQLTNHLPKQQQQQLKQSLRLSIISNIYFPIEIDSNSNSHIFLDNKLVNSNGWSLSYNNSLLMIKKCVPLFFKVSSSPLSFPRSSTAIITVFSNQTKRNTNKQQTNPVEGEFKMKPKIINPIFQGASQQQCGNKREFLQDYDGEHVFSGEQKSYFLAVTSIILLVNLTIRMFIEPHAPFKTYERNV